MKYGQAIVKKIKTLAKKGLTNTQICKALNIGVTTIQEWRSKYPSFAGVLDLARDHANMDVENALYKSAVGYETKETHTTSKKVGKAKVKAVETKVVNKSVAPNNNSIIFYLKNKLPDEYRDRREDLIALVSKDDLKKSADDINAIIAGLDKKTK